MPETRKSTHPTTTTTDASNTNNISSGVKKVPRPHSTTTNTTKGIEVDDDKKNSSNYSYNKSDKGSKVYLTPKKTPIRYVYLYSIYYTVYLCVP